MQYFIFSHESISLPMMSACGNWDKECACVLSPHTVEIMDMHLTVHERTDDLVLHA